MLLYSPVAGLPGEALRSVLLRSQQPLWHCSRRQPVGSLDAAL